MRWRNVIKALNSPISTVIDATLFSEHLTAEKIDDAIRNLAKALSVSADMLLFEKDERGPDEDLKLQFEAVSRLDPEEKKIIRSVIESILLRHEARRWSTEKGG
jgi:hypothetical protein